jgi:hypothetical protein
MPNFYRLITGLLITCFIITACTPATPPSPTASPLAQASATSLPSTSTPFPTDTAIPQSPTPSSTPLNPTSTLTATLSQPTPTPTPTQITPSPTPLPGPELLTYLPPVKDMLEKCTSFEYNQTTTLATLNCTMRVGALGLAIITRNQPYTQKDIQSLAGYNPITAPKVGTGSQAFKSTNGRTTSILFFKGNTLVRVTSTGFSGYLPLETIVDEAKKIDALLPEMNAPYARLSFPEKLAKEKLNDYFKILTVSVGPSRTQGTEINLTDQVCLTEYALRPNPREFYEAALVDMQTNLVVKKTIYQMRYRIHCGSLKPAIAARDYKVGDRYEIRVAVGDNVVAIFPLVTR